MMSCPNKSRDDERVICVLMQHYEQNLDYIWPHYTRHLQWVLLVSNALAGLLVYKTSVSPHFSLHLETLSFCLKVPVVKHIIYIIKQMEYKNENNGKIACPVAAFTGFIIFQVHLQVHRWLSPSANVAWVCFTMWFISWWNYTLREREKEIPDAFARCLWKPENLPQLSQSEDPAMFHLVVLVQLLQTLPPQLLLWIWLPVPSSFALSACPNPPTFIHSSEYYKNLPNRKKKDSAMTTTTNCFLFHQECKLGGCVTLMLIQPANYKTSNWI